MFFLILNDNKHLGEVKHWNMKYYNISFKLAFEKQVQLNFTCWLVSPSGDNSAVNAMLNQ